MFVCKTVQNIWVIAHCYSCISQLTYFSQHFNLLDTFVCLDYSRLCVSIPRRTLPVAVLSSRDGSKNSDQTEVQLVAPTLLKLFGSDNMEPDCSKAEKQQTFRTLQKVSFIFKWVTIEADVCIRILLLHKMRILITCKTALMRICHYVLLCIHKVFRL